MPERWTRTDEATRAAIEAIADRHEVGLLELAVANRPDDFDLLVRLSELYSTLGQARDGLAIDLQLVVMAPNDPIVRYNLACSLSATGRVHAALSALKEALRLGYTDIPHLLHDPDLEMVRAADGFTAVREWLRARPALQPGAPPSGS